MSEKLVEKSKIRELNAHLAELNAHLEERVVLRTEQLSRSNEELAQFAYVASHDLQEPLRTVSLYTQLLAKRYGDELEGDAQQFMRYIFQNAQRMELLVQDLLNFCQVDGRATDHFSLFSCEAALDQALANLKARIQERKAVITRDPLPDFVGDPVQITSVFQNLVANSIKYQTPEEAPVIHIA